MFLKSLNGFTSSTAIAAFYGVFGVSGALLLSECRIEVIITRRGFLLVEGFRFLGLDLPTV
jgi:hypothetical protein